MTGRQFKFSISVGGSLVALGLAIAPQATAGISLMAVRIGLCGLSVIHFRSARNSRQTLPLPVHLGQASGQDLSGPTH